MNNSPIFIVGCDRSGTTLVRLMLNQHSRIAIPDESDFMSILIDRRERYGDLNQDENLNKFCDDLFSVKRYMLWNLDNGTVKRRMTESGRSLDELLRIPYELVAEQKGKKRWGDKTPRYTRYIADIRGIFPDAKFIHIIRDGRDVAASLKKVEWFSNDIVNISYHWKDMVSAALACKETLGSDYMEIRYETLVRSPEQTLREICAFIGEEYESQLLEYQNNAADNFAEMYRGDHELLKQKPTARRINTWHSNLDAQEIRIFELIAGKLLETVGYRKSTNAIERLRVLRVWRRIILHRLSKKKIYAEAG